MARTGYHIPLPNGKIRLVTVNSDEERQKIAKSLQEEWKDYCNRNWDNDDGSMYPPESRVKKFLDVMAMFVVEGASKDNGIISPYKEKSNQDHEIPLSSCPAFVQDCVYGNRPSGKSEIKSQTDSFRNTLGSDQIKTKKKRPSVKVKDRQEKVSEWKKNEGIKSVHRCIVNTDGEFSFHGIRYGINLEAVPQYKGTILKSGDIVYDMDFIIVGETGEGTLKFCDQNINSVDCVHIYKL